MLGALSIDTYLPALPAIAKHFSISVAVAQQTLTIYLGGYAFMTLFFGTLSDSFGRRPVILGSLGCYLLSSVGAAFAPNFAALMLFRLLQGLSAGGGQVVGRAMIADLFTGRAAQRIMAIVSMVFGLAPAIAPVLGGWLQDIAGWRWIFGFIAVFALVLLTSCLRWLPESLAPSLRHPFRLKPILVNYGAVAASPRFLAKCVGNALAFAGPVVYIGAAPVFVLGMLHLSVRDFGWLFIPMIGGMTLGSFLTAKMSHRYAPRTIIGTGYAIMAAGTIADLLYTALCPIEVPWAVIPVSVYGLGMAYAMPAMSILTLEMFPKTKGLASSLISFIFTATFAVGSGVITPLLFGSAFHLAAGIAAGLLLSATFWRLGSPASEGARLVEHVTTPEEFPVEV